MSSVSSRTTVEEEAPCRRCRYLLKSLRTDGNCPECGECIRDSLRAHAARGERQRILCEWFFGISAILLLMLLMFDVLLVGLALCHVANAAGLLAFEVYAVRLVGFISNAAALLFTVVALVLLQQGAEFWWRQSGWQRRRVWLRRALYAQVLLSVLLGGLFIWS